MIIGSGKKKKERSHNYNNYTTHTTLDNLRNPNQLINGTSVRKKKKCVIWRNHFQNSPRLGFCACGVGKLASLVMHFVAKDFFFILNRFSAKQHPSLISAFLGEHNILCFCQQRSLRVIGWELFLIFPVTKVDGFKVRLNQQLNTYEGHDIAGAVGSPPSCSSKEEDRSELQCRRP